MTDIPESIRIPEDKRKETAPSIRIEYLDIPSVNPERPCRIRVVIHNSGNEVLKGSLVIHRIPEELELNKNHIGLQLMPGEVHEEEIRISVREDYDRLFDKNVMEAEFAGISRAFGVCGAAVWEAVGPFLEPLTGTEGNEGDGIGEEAPGEEEEVETGPQLPTMECMVNNAAYLDKEYIDEKDLEKAFSREDPQPVYQAEDMLPMDETFTFHGQGCIYLRQKLLSPETRRVWVIIGNNDGYVLWVNGREVMRKDTIRLWTPYNNYFSVELKAGVNEIGLKLLRRTESLRFSIAFRRHEGDFFHRKRWLTDMASVRLN